MTFKARWTSYEEIPFFALVNIHKAQNHLSNGKALSSKIVPSLAVYCLRQSLHWYTLPRLQKALSQELHFGQAGP